LKLFIRQLVFCQFTFRKGIIRDILGQFPSLSDEDLASTFKLKESEITLCKLETHDSTHVVVYLINKIPYFFKIEKELQFIPTGKHEVFKGLSIEVIKIFLLKYIFCGDSQSYCQSSIRINKSSTNLLMAQTLCCLE